MARTVQFSEEAYRWLRQFRRPGESFSQALMRLARERKDPLRLLELGPRDDEVDLAKMRAMSDAIDKERARDRGL